MFSSALLKGAKTMHKVRQVKKKVGNRPQVPSDPLAAPATDLSHISMLIVFF